MKFNNENIRRQDRILDEKRAFEILKEGEYGILSMQSEDGQGAYGIPLTETDLHRPLPTSILLCGRKNQGDSQ